VIEVHVKPGDTVAAEEPLITLESDKATMDVPASQAGTVAELRVKPGDRVSQGSVILLLEAAGAAPVKPKETVREDASPAPETPPISGSPCGVFETIVVAVPDIGDFKDVAVIEVHAAVGESVKAEDPLITLESDKATMDVPSPTAGTISEITVKVGDRVSQGSLILKLSTGAKREAVATVSMPHAAPAARPPSTTQGDVHAEVLVLGSGPGGYTAAFRAADLGKKVVIVERWPVLGGVCLNVGCIPSKALLHAAKVIEETHEMSAHGLSFASPAIDVDKLRGWKDGVVKRLTGGLSGLAKQRKVTVVEGVGKFVSLNQLEVTGKNGTQTVSFEQAIIAAGSEPVTLPFIPHSDPRVIDSTGALELGGIPKRLLVLGGGIIGLEMATVYHALGARVTVVELMDQIIPGAIGDIVGQPMLAHKATHEGKVAAEAAAGRNSFFDAKVIPSVAYTDPEVAWAGITENEAKAKGIKYGKGVFPWAASGRSLSLGRDEGVTKLLFDEATNRLLGCGIVGPNAGELIAEAALAIEMGADAEDIGLTVHPHPTLSETVAFAAEMFEGTITDLLAPKKK
jgi:dihydrolipoamide dehydrogenase